MISLANSSIILEIIKFLATPDNKIPAIGYVLIDKVAPIVRKTKSMHNAKKEPLRKPVVGLRHIKFDHNIASKNFMINVANQIMSDSNTVMNASTFQETRLRRPDDGPKNFLQPRVQDIRDNLVNKIAKTNRYELIKGVRFLHFRKKNDIGRRDNIGNLQSFKETLDGNHKVSTNNIPTGGVEFTSEAIRPMGATMIHLIHYLTNILR
ncbi:hypothetical protein QQ045_013177 [Rhodiola kirilowii]